MNIVKVIKYRGGTPSARAFKQVARPITIKVLVGLEIRTINTISLPMPVVNGCHGMFFWGEQGELICGKRNKNGKMYLSRVFMTMSKYLKSS